MPSNGSARSQNLASPGSIDSLIGELRGCGDALRRERIGPDGRAFGPSAEPIEVVRPSAVVGVGGEVVEAAVDEPQQRCVVSVVAVRSISTVVEPGGISTSARSQP